MVGCPETPRDNTWYVTSVLVTFRVATRGGSCHAWFCDGVSRDTRCCVMTYFIIAILSLS